MREPGLVVKVGDSYSEGCEFKSRSQILDGHFSHLFVVQIVLFFEKTKINEKRPGLAHFLKKDVKKLFHNFQVCQDATSAWSTKASL